MSSKTRNALVISSSIYIVLAIILAVWLFVALGLQDAFAQVISAILLIAAHGLQTIIAHLILASLGSAIFGSGLAFFLVHMTAPRK